MSLILVFALLFLLTFTVLAVEVIIWQSNDISVSIDTDSKETQQELSITVKNTAGLTLLFFENQCINGCIEYLNGNQWEKFCDIYYTTENINAISQQYAGVFAELNPGEDWSVSISDDDKARMIPGTYRIKLTYTTASDYKKFLDKKYSALSDISSDNTDAVDFSNDTGSDNEVSQSENVFESIRSEVFVKTFEFGDADGFVVSDDSQVGPVLNEKYSYIPNVEHDI